MSSPAEAETPLETAPSSQAKMSNEKYSIEDVLLGMKLASLAITDDKEGTLRNVGKLNPWHIEALTLITGSREEAHKPLTHILKEHMDLICDVQIDQQGLTPGLHFLDTQGYIAHNDEMVVLAYRCTTSVFDWLTNFNTTCSAWEIEEDVAQGYSGFLSGFSGLCCNRGDYKPRVHTGFYNNFLSTVKHIREHIDPLLRPGQPPRKLFVVGHSLGAGVATLAACYFLLEHDWSQLPQHQLITVTAGSPRSVQNSMREAIGRERERLRKPGEARSNVSICRVVRDQDIVATLPPAWLGFRHLDDLVMIAGDDTVTFNPTEHRGKEVSTQTTEIASVMKETPEEVLQKTETTEEEEENAYEKKVNRIPKALRDHMPDFYLKPLMAEAHHHHIPQTRQDGVVLSPVVAATSVEEGEESMAEEKEIETMLT